ncbi:MAG: hypothetical protein GWO24_22645, partial [Akkermansiaceae bacterium]|nr:hypothetical protein [Akkermansiaceae bacterium]
DGEIEEAMRRRDKEGGTREELARKLGLPRDRRPAGNAFEYVDTRTVPRAAGKNFTVRHVRWRAFGDVYGSGVIFEPDDEPRWNLIAIPDADQDPETICGLPPRRDVPATTSYVPRLAEAGCRVLVPVLINRSEIHAMPAREWLHRSAWELGRTLAGYEVQKVLAAVDCLASAPPSRTGKLGVVGWGEGGRLALYAAALDPRIDGALVSGYFGPRGRVWDEPADRTVFGLLRGHSDAEIAGLIAPRPLIIEHGVYPEAGFRLDAQGKPERLARGAGKRGKPGKLLVPTLAEAKEESGKIGSAEDAVEFRETGRALADESLLSLLRHLGGKVPEKLPAGELGEFSEPVSDGEFVAARHAGQMAEIDHHNQWALIDSQRVRGGLFGKVNTKSLEGFEESIAP